MADSPPVSVVLPTVEPTGICEQIADQLEPGDELLVVCDSPDDPIADRVSAFDGRVRLVVAGEPEGCSGKANAVAAAMEAARNDRIAWTDDDFDHPPGWLEQLHADYERHGPVSELPFFVGRDPLAVLFEPTYAIHGTLGVYATNSAWGGAVIFERDDLEWDRFLADLRSTISDDGLLGEYLDVTPVRRTRRVAVGGEVRESLERHVRFVKIVARHGPHGPVRMSVGACALAAACVLFPLPALALSTLVVTAVYAAFGVRRWTALLAYPAMLAQVPLLAYALARRTFVWGGRRYRWRSTFDVEIVE